LLAAQIGRISKGPSGLLTMPGIDYVGRCRLRCRPPSYATARSTSAKETTAANEFVKFLSSKSVVPSARRMRLDPA
jgi:hypothetical protein